MKNTIKVDMRGKKYSLLVDETTDISVEKICARYFSEMESKVVTVFLGLYRTINTTGAEVFSVIENCIAEYDLVIENMIGFGECDGASSMVGSHNSVFSRIQAANPHTVLMKCVCHSDSLALYVQHAFEVMPSDVGYILSVISSWFSNSDIRRMEYQCWFEAFEIDGNANEDSTLFGSVCGSVAMPFVKFSKTRWLVRAVVPNLSRLAAPCRRELYFAAPSGEPIQFCLKV